MKSSDQVIVNQYIPNITSSETQPSSAESSELILHTYISDDSI